MKKRWVIFSQRFFCGLFIFKKSFPVFNGYVCCVEYAAECKCTIDVCVGVRKNRFAVEISLKSC